MANIAELVEVIKGMTALELKDLKEALQDEFGVTAAAPVAVMAAAPVAEAAAEKDSFDVELTAVGDKKLEVIKVVREVTSLGLKEAKELVDGAPKVIKEGLSKDEAEALKAKLSETGATITLK